MAVTVTVAGRRGVPGQKPLQVMEVMAASTLTAARAKGLAAPPKLSGLAGGGASAPDGSPVLAGLRKAHADVHTALHRAMRL